VLACIYPCISSLPSSPVQLFSNPVTVVDSDEKYTRTLEEPWRYSIPTVSSVKVTGCPGGRACPVLNCIESRLSSILGSSLRFSSGLDWCSDWCEYLPVQLGTYSKFLCALHELNFRVALQARGVVTVQGALASCLADTTSPSRCDARWSALTVGARGAPAGQTGNNTVSRDYEKIVCYLSVCCDDSCILSCHVASSVIK